MCGKGSTSQFELHNKRKYRKIRDMILENNVEENQLMGTFSVSVYALLLMLFAVGVVFIENFWGILYGRNVLQWILF